MTPMRLEPAVLQSRVKHSTTEPLRSLVKGGTPLLCRGNLFTDVMCTSDSMDSCMAPGFWQTLISIADVRKKYCSEIESSVQIEAHGPEIPVVLRSNTA